MVAPLIRVLHVEDVPQVRQGFAAMLSRDPEVRLVGKRGKLFEALRAGAFAVEPALEVRITDDGTGIQPSALQRATGGLANLRSRSAAMGGELLVTSRPGRTSLSFRLSRDAHDPPRRRHEA